MKRRARTINSRGRHQCSQNPVKTRSLQYHSLAAVPVSVRMLLTFWEIYVSKISCWALCFDNQYSIAGAQFTNNLSNLPAYHTVITQSLSSWVTDVTDVHCRCCGQPWVFSLGYHLDECWLVALRLVVKIWKLVVLTHIEIRKIT